MGLGIIPVITTSIARKELKIESTVTGDNSGGRITPIGSKQVPSMRKIIRRGNHGERVYGRWSKRIRGDVEARIRGGEENEAFVVGERIKERGIASDIGNYTSGVARGPRGDSVIIIGYGVVCVKP